MRLGNGHIGNNLAGNRPFSGTLDNIVVAGALNSFETSHTIPQIQILNHANNEQSYQTICLHVLACPNYEANGAIGQALSFDGYHDYFSLDNQDVMQNDYTIATWFKVTDNNKSQPILSAIDPNSGHEGLHLGLSSTGQLTYKHHFPPEATAVAITSTKTISNNTWHYALATRTNDTLTLYLDGQAMGSQPVITGSTALQTIRLGQAGQDGSATFYQGSLDQLTIIPGGVSANGVNFLMNNTYPSLTIPDNFIPYTAKPQTSQQISGTVTIALTTTNSVHQIQHRIDGVLELQNSIDIVSNAPYAISRTAYFPFDDAPGSTIFDRLSEPANTYNCTPGDLTCYDLHCHTDQCPLAGLRGQIDQAVYFDGLNDRLYLKNNAYLDPTIASKQTYAMWVKAERGTIFSTLSNPSDVDGIHLTFDNFAIRVFNMGISGANATFEDSINLTLPKNQWVHVAVVENGGTHHIYINGMWVGSTSYSTYTYPTPDNSPLTIGSQGKGGNPLHGYIDDFRIYDAALSANEIATLYTTTGPLMRFSFDEPSNHTTFMDGTTHQTVGYPSTETCAPMRFSTVTLTAAPTTTTLKVYLDDTLVGSPSPLTQGQSNSLDQDTILCGFGKVSVKAVTAAGTVTDLGSQTAVVTTTATTSHTFTNGSTSVTLGPWTFGTDTTLQYNPPPGNPGKIGNTALFNGHGYIRVPQATAVNSLTNTYTIMAWVKPDNLNNNQTILAHQVTAGTDGVALKLAKNKLAFHHFGGTIYTTTNTLKDTGSWQHVAVIVDVPNNKQYFYVNGRLLETNTTITTASANDDGDDLIIGAFQNANGDFEQYFNGEIDELVIYGRVFSASELFSTYQRELLSYRALNISTIQVDTDDPTITLLSDTTYRAQGYVQLAVGTHDASTAVRLLEMGLKGPNDSDFTWQDSPACSDAQTSIAWCPSFTTNSEGTYQLKFRAVDAVGNQTISQVYTFYVDNTAPTAATTYSDTVITPTPIPNMELGWTIALSGTLSDPALAGGPAGSGILTQTTYLTQTIQVDIQDSKGQRVGNTFVMATLNGSSWTANYAFLGPVPLGTYTIYVTAQDVVGNRQTTAVGTIRMDARAPYVEVPQQKVISQTLITGTAVEAPRWSSQVAHYHFEESTSPFADSSGNDFKATCTTCPVGEQTAVFGNGLTFDGLNDILTSSHSFPADQAFTIALWLKADSSQTDTSHSTNTIIEKSAGSGSYPYAIHYLNSSGQLSLSRSDGSHTPQITSTIALTDSQFHHIAFTKDGKTLSLYIDGQLNSTTTDTTTSPVTNTAPIYIGASASDSKHFKGTLDELAIYHQALTAEQLFALAQQNVAGVASVEVQLLPIPNSLPDGTVAYLSLDEAAGSTTFVDATTYDNDAHCVQCPTSGLSAIDGQGVQFDGVDDILQIPDNGDLDFETYTIAFWLHPTQITADWQFLLSKESNYITERSYGLYFYPNSTAILLTWQPPACNTWIEGGATPALPLNAWSHVATTYDGTISRIYLNGEQVDERPYSGGFCQTTHPIHIGGSPSTGDDNFVGQFDNIYLAQRALTPLEISQLGSPTFSTWPTLSTTTPWQTATLPQTNQALTPWSHPIPANTEGIYQLNTRTTDALGNASAENTIWRGVIDNQVPLVTLTRQITTANAATYTLYTLTAKDRFLDNSTLYVSACINDALTIIPPTLTTLTATATCQVSGYHFGYVTATACDIAGQCSSDNTTPIVSFSFNESNSATSFDGQTVTASCSTGMCPVSEVNGRYGTALQFDGNDDHLTIPDSGMVDFAADQDFTVAVWVKTDTIQNETTYGDNDIVEKWNSLGGYPYIIRYFNQTDPNNGKIAVARYDGANNPAIISTSTIHDGAFHHIAFVKNGTTLSLYIDGQLEGTTLDTTTGTTTNNSPLYIGERGSGLNNFTGIVDELTILSWSLTAAEINGLMNSN